MAAIQDYILLNFFALAIISFSGSCSSTRNIVSENIYNGTWELEYISGPRIAFNGLFPTRKPKIAFDKETQKVEGNTSCNGYSASFILAGNAISFDEPGPTTRMYCGEGEKVFLSTMRKINKYSIGAEGKLNLMIDKVSMMRFKKA